MFSSMLVVTLVSQRLARFLVVAAIAVALVAVALAVADLTVANGALLGPRIRLSSDPVTAALDGVSAVVRMTPMGLKRP